MLPEKILIATGNKYKFKEFKEIITSAIKYSSDGIIFAPDFASSIVIEETGSSYIENAVLKAEAWCRISNMPSLADDSGFEVEALNNAPGIFSNRIINGGDDLKIKWVLDQLKNNSKRKARFVAALALKFPDGRIFTSEGYCSGRVAIESSGLNGFGYDPIFIPDNFSKTFAEIEPELKNKISHRADAFRNLIKQL